MSRSPSRPDLTTAGVLLGLALLLGGAAGAPRYETVPVPDGGTLAGVVRFVGTVPPAAFLPVARHRDLCGDRQRSAALVVGADREVAGSVVVVEGITRGRRPQGDVVIDTRRCAFVPHVLAAPAGVHVRVRNADGLVHNVRGVLGRMPVFNVAVPNKDQEVDVTRRLTRPGAVRLTCDVHPHMLGWLYVHDSPYVAVTDERGAYRIDSIPPGTYRVTMWHEGFRARGTPVTVTRTVTIRPGASATLDFSLGPSKASAGRRSAPSRVLR